jgi:hypothetical protein
MDSRENKIARINAFLNVYSEEQLDILELVMQTYSTSYINKGDLMKLVLTEKENRKCDSALPNDYVGHIKEVLPTFNPYINVYDYSTNTFGEMRNLGEDLHEKLKGLNSYSFI